MIWFGQTSGGICVTKPYLQYLLEIILCSYYRPANCPTFWAFKSKKEGQSHFLDILVDGKFHCKNNRKWCLFYPEILLKHFHLFIVINSAMKNLPLKGHWTTSASSPNFFQKCWDFYIIRSVYLCSDCMLNLTCSFNSVTKIYAFFFQ